ncbi:DUF4269 domain-containing protein [Catalinimonas sp. 4WD22]|uniref:DUF4269 domain-containing protein n=1 Tax=Catalinimonas locisalis TaxID=3133978 RepID=UPI003100D994
MSFPFYSLQALQSGTPVQQQAAQCLQHLELKEKLKAYSPVLCGTIPLNLNVSGSDLDIICEAADFRYLESILLRHYAHLSDFSIRHTEIRRVLSLVTNFSSGDFKIEVFVQAQPVKQQYAFRHMCIEKRILDLAGDSFCQQVICLKAQGLKTEPAFAQLLKLQGDPYDALLELESYRDNEILYLL